MSERADVSFREFLPALDVPLGANPLDRADASRGKPEELQALASRSDARLLALWSGKPLIDLEGGSAELGWRAMSAAADNAELMFLGLDHGAARFAVRLEAESEAAALTQLGDGASGARFIDLRSIAKDLSSSSASIVAEAKSLTDWRASHRFCSRCGAPTAVAQGGWRTDCGACGATHFPRTDPVVIMLATRRGADGVDRVVLGRQKGWPPGLFSLLAGYVEAGETVEAAARRETFEESGLEVGDVVYLASQPWPFPSTLMIGVWAELLSDQMQPDLDELDACMWASRAEIRSVLDGGELLVSAPGFGSAPMMAPRSDAIARTIITAWATGEFDGLLGPERR